MTTVGFDGLLFRRLFDACLSDACFHTSLHPSLHQFLCSSADKHTPYLPLFTRLLFPYSHLVSPVSLTSAGKPRFSDLCKEKGQLPRLSALMKKRTLPYHDSSSVCVWSQGRVRYLHPVLPASDGGASSIVSFLINLFLFTSSTKLAGDEFPFCRTSRKNWSH